jgi:hypothetical protein
VRQSDALAERLDDEMSADSRGGYRRHVQTFILAARASRYFPHRAFSVRHLSTDRREPQRVR